MTRTRRMPSSWLKNMATHPVHDHVVLLLSTEDFENPLPWLTDQFNVIDGGTPTGSCGIRIVDTVA